MNGNIPVDMPTTYWTTERLSEFWGYVIWFLQYNMPIFMICMAVLVVGLVIYIIVDIPLEAKRQQDGRRDRDDDPEIEYY